ncbi:MAG: transposase [Methanobacteriaceae archaeon]|jgi:transposase|nr:transposase [Methanobacteriaceae archaeon]
MAIFIDPYFQRLDKILNPKCSLLLQLSKNNIHIWPRLEERKKIVLKQILIENNIKEKLRTEKTINIVLDNYTVHHASLIKDIAEILNINLIYLPSNSPELNPIEDLWRIIKRTVTNTFIKSKKSLENLYTTLFYEKVNDKTLYENWLEEFIISNKS